MPPIASLNRDCHVRGGIGSFFMRIAETSKKDPKRAPKATNWKIWPAALCAALNPAALGSRHLYPKLPASGRRRAPPAQLSSWLPLGLFLGPFLIFQRFA